VTDVQQKLLEVSREITGRNYLLRRNITKKDDDPLYMIPELCNVHTLTASLWKQVGKIAVCFFALKLNKTSVDHFLDCVDPVRPGTIKSAFCG
jgi:hypothetical protein